MVEMDRDRMIDALGGGPWDVLVIGGGATGLGVAVDAQTRGYRTLLLEAHDFAKGTSSRSTKLVHGGVRYLQQGNVALVLEALRERGLMCRNAAHLVQNLAFVVPQYRWWEGPFYGIGLKLYDRLAGKLNIARSRVLDRETTIEKIPNVETDGLLGGVQYHDAQFDDARMAVTLARTAVDHGAIVVNYMPVVGLVKRGRAVVGVTAEDRETGRSYDLQASVVINATGVFADGIRKMDDDETEPMIAPSQGVHVVLDRGLQPSDTAIMVPHTDDGRVLFVIPWHGRVLVGTTDTPVDRIDVEPRPFHEEIGFILRNAARYLERQPSESDILSCFAGLRPLVHEGTLRRGTKAMSREHSVMVSDSGLVTIIGGKWTTYRKMAQDTVDDAAEVGGLPERPCVTEDLPLHGSLKPGSSVVVDDAHMRVYGSEVARVHALLEEEPGGGDRLHPRLPYRRGEVAWAIRREMARTLEDVLSRRTRSLLLDARAAREVAPEVAAIMAGELGRDAEWVRRQVEEFDALARGYLPAAEGDKARPRPPGVGATQG
jgi:glycerol-3-phosphate dehydrogenase